MKVTNEICMEITVLLIEGSQGTHQQKMLKGKVEVGMGEQQLQCCDASLVPFVTGCLHPSRWRVTASLQKPFIEN